jgi:hypothetical protein
LWLPAAGLKNFKVPPQRLVSGETGAILTLRKINPIGHRESIYYLP